MSKHNIIVTIVLMCAALTAAAQTRKIQHKPYIDLRPMHFGILVGMNMQDIEFENVGPQTITLEDGTTHEETIVCDDDRWNAGFSVGVLADLRLSKHLNLRFSPTMHFGAKLPDVPKPDRDRPGGAPNGSPSGYEEYLYRTPSRYKIQCREMEQLSPIHHCRHQSDAEPDK